MEELCWGWFVTVKGSCPQLLKSHLVVGTVFITFVEELFDDLDLPLNDAMAPRVMSTACSHGKFPLPSKFIIPFVVNWVPLSQMISSGVPGTEKRNSGQKFCQLSVWY